MTHKEIQLPSGKYLLVEVPDKSIEFRLDNGYPLMTLKYENPGDDQLSEYYPDGWSPLQGTWSIVGKASELKEEQWKDIVESDWWYDGPQEEHGLGKVTFYREYPKEIEYSVLLSSIESGLSLIQSHSMKPETTLILKAE